MNNYMGQIKLVIWDLDNTFWKGILSEEKVQIIPKNVDIVKELTDRGIMNSICSKNDFAIAKQKLQELCIFDFFIFPIINWKAKGPQICEMIKIAGLRQESVLFIDDDEKNIEEVKYYCPSINTALPDVIEHLLEMEELQGSVDIEHTRLSKYKILEKKQEEKEKYASNEEFLENSGIKVELLFDCLNNVERINELINRTNQLNYTKKRVSKEDLINHLKNPKYRCGYIKVSDRYGDYGVVGFFSEHQGTLEHFLFSCRVIGMGVEQWVYAKLGWPEIVIQEPVISKLTKKQDAPDWINTSDNGRINRLAIESNNKRILLRGGCDLSQIIPYMDVGKGIICEFNEGRYHRDHTHILRGIWDYSDEEKNFLIDRMPFLADNTFESLIQIEYFDVIIISLLMDYTQNVYAIKNRPNLKVAYGDYNTPYEEDVYWDMDDDRKNYFQNNVVSRGIISKRELYDNLMFLRDHIDSRTKLIFINGCEVSSTNQMERVNTRELIHKEYNKTVDEFIAGAENTYLLDMRKIINSTDDLLDNIRHYKRYIYFKMAIELSKLV